MDRIEIAGCTVELIRGNIVQQDTTAIVNAANRHLAGGGGVDGTIHAAGGPTIMAETRSKYPAGCQTGSAVITSGGNLKARYVIHAVGPIYRGTPADANLLRSVYQSCLELAEQNQIRSIAFPAISTGIYGYPVAAATAIAADAVRSYFKITPESCIKLLRFIAFDEQTLNVYRQEFGLK